MSKRAAASLLWFAAILVGYEIAWSLTGIPRAFGPIIATAVSAFVGVDPARLFWPRPATSDRTIMPTERTPVHS
jgi:hypothetical protein